MSDYLNIQQEIEQKFGFFPAFLTPALPIPHLLENLWHNYQIFYQHNPFPTLFKAKLALLLSRHCAGNTAIIYHSFDLYQLGISQSEIDQLLKLSHPTAANIQADLQRLQRLKAVPVSIPFALEIENDLLRLASFLFLAPSQSQIVRACLKHLLGDAFYPHLITLLNSIQMLHQWIESYPELTEDYLSQIQSFFKKSSNTPESTQPFLKYFISIRPIFTTSQEQKISPRFSYLQTLLDYAPMVIFLKDRQGRYCLVNRQFEILCGLSRTQILGRTDLEIFSLSTAQFFQNRDQQIMSLGVPLEFEEKLEFSNGKRAYLTNKFPLFDEQGQILGLGGISLDITEQKEREIELRELNDRLEELVQSRTEELQMIFEALPDQIFMIERETMQIAFCNNSLAQVSGYQDRRELQGKTIFEIYSPAQATYFAQQNQQVFETGKTLHTQETLAFQQQTLYIDTYKIPLKRSNGEVYALIGTSRDISELVQARQALASRTQQLEATNHELESFSYSVSHDLRAPLRHIHGFVEALKDRLQGLEMIEDDKVTRYIQVIEDSCIRMRQLIDGLLSLSQVGRREITFTSVNLRYLVEQSLEIIRSSLLNREVAIDCHIGQLPTVRGDQALLQQVFTNLLHNAVKFSRDTKDNKFQNHTSIQIKVDTLPDGTFYVQDQGVGFSMAYADQLFGVFQRLHSTQAFEGVGVGLAIVQRIIHRHGGQIWAESQPQQGATFYFTLPTPEG